MTRTITVYNSSTQEKKVFENVEVNTLAEVKSLLRENGISYDGMDFMEGVSQTKLLNDTSVLPHDIPYKGSTTNDLLIYMTLKDKKVRSGVDFKSMDRRTLLGYIKEHGWVEEVNKAFNANYTRVSSASLIDFCVKKEGTSGMPAPAAPAETPAEGCPGEKAINAIKTLAKALYEDGYIDTEVYDAVTKALEGKKEETPAPAKEAGFSQEEIDNMIADL